MCIRRKFWNFVQPLDLFDLFSQEYFCVTCDKSGANLEFEKELLGFFYYERIIFWWKMPECRFYWQFLLKSITLFALFLLFVMISKNQNKPLWKNSIQPSWQENRVLFYQKYGSGLSSCSLVLWERVAELKSMLGGQKIGFGEGNHQRLEI